MTGLIIFLIIILFLVLSSVEINFVYNNNFCITVKLFRITVYSSKNKRKKAQKDKQAKENRADRKFENELNNIKEIFGKLKSILKELNKLLNGHLKIKNLDIKYTYGFDDAALTGIFSGLAYGIINSLVAYIDHNFYVKNKKVEILPDFDNEIQSLSLIFTAKIRLFHLLTFGIKAARLWLK